MAADSKPVKKAFGPVLRKARETAQLTQMELGARAGFDMVYISYLESGRSQPSLAALLAFERVMRLPFGTLAFRTGEAMTNAVGQ